MGEAAMAEEEEEEEDATTVTVSGATIVTLRFPSTRQISTVRIEYRVISSYTNSYTTIASELTRLLAQGMHEIDG